MENQKMKFEDLKFETMNDGFLSGKKCRIFFENGFGASIVSHDFSYGGKAGLYEIAVLDSTGELHYSNPVANGDVLGYLTEEDVEKYINQIQKL